MPFSPIPRGKQKKAKRRFTIKNQEGRRRVLAVYIMYCASADDDVCIVYYIY